MMPLDELVTPSVVDSVWVRAGAMTTLDKKSVKIEPSDDDDGLDGSQLDIGIPFI